MVFLQLLCGNPQHNVFDLRISPLSHNHHIWVNLDYIINDIFIDRWITDDMQVSETMSSYFANLIKTGNPNGMNLPEWQAAGPNDSAPPVMIIDVHSRTEKAVNDKRYELLDKLTRKSL